MIYHGTSNGETPPLTLLGIRVYRTGVMSCPYRAVLLVTRDMCGTASSVATERVELQCGEPEGHEGAHHDLRSGIHWEDRGKTVRTLLRDETEPFRSHYP